MDCGTVRPISRRSINLEFYPLQLPPHPIGPSLSRGRTREVTVQSLGDNSSKSRGWRFQYGPVNCAHPWQVVQKPLWHMTCIILPLVIISDRSVASSSVHFLYKYHTPPFSFLYFLLKHTVRAHPSYLSETTPFSCWIRHQHLSSVH